MSMNEIEDQMFPESTASDESEPPPGSNFPKPDFTEMIPDEGGPSAKPTFKSALQAKKRLQAFSTTRSLPVSPSSKKAKYDQKQEEAAKKVVKKVNCHEDKARAVIDEIEELKREELAYLQSKKSRSRSTDKGRFKKVYKKSRNYRRRSSTDDKPRRVKKVQSKPSPKKNPRNWHEFLDLGSSFSTNPAAPSTPNVCNELLRQMCFELPSLPIVPFKMKTANREDKEVPFKFMRYTKAKPVIPFSVNFGAIKQVFIPRKSILEALPKHTVAIIEKLHSTSFKCNKTEGDKKMNNQSRSWYPKIWKDAETDCKLLEKSVGLSFLQTYTGEEEEMELGDEAEVALKTDDVERPESKTSRKKRLSESEGKKTKKRKKSKTKKKKERTKEKKKSKEKAKKKKEKKAQSEEKVVDKPNKQQVMEELRMIEEKLAKKREQDKHKQEEKSRKREHSEQGEDIVKRANKKSAGDEAKKSAKDKHVDKKPRTEDGEKRKSQVCEAQPINEQEVLDKETTPDTDEYHSHWESDDDVSSSAPRQSAKLNRSWESDEELFERSNNTNKTQSETYSNLEIPLNIKSIARRELAPLVYLEEFKLLEEERRTLSEERKKLELEKQRILQLKEEAKLEDNKAAEDVSATTPIKIKKETHDSAEFNIDSLNSSLLSTVSSSESNFPIAVLENQYEEFMKAVSSDPAPAKRRISSTSSWSSSSSSSDSDHKKKKRKAKSKKKRKKKRKNEPEGLLGKSNIFDEFDIPVPSDLPEMVPPLPVPSPLELSLVPKPNLLAETKPDPVPDLKKPFVFPSIVLTKKTTLVDNSSLNLNDDSDSNDFTEKLTKKCEAVEEEEQPVLQEESEKPKPATEHVVQEVVEKVVESEVPSVEEVAKEVAPPKTAPVAKESKPKRRSDSPPRKSADRPREKRRSRSRSPKRRTPVRRRDPSPPSRRRRLLRRRLSPRRRTPPRRRRRTPSMSPPPRPRGGLRKRTPSPRGRRSSPLNSPLDGFKRSVADSTISDDMLPQINPDDYVESPQAYGKIYRGTRRSSTSPPTNSPKRISLDERINQVLGVEKNEPPPPKPMDAYNNYGYNPYTQYPQYNQYNQFGPMMYAQPPPPVKAAPTPTKVVQVGNILQVVPSEEIPSMPPSMMEARPVERSQKIVQVGNMLQIVPAVMPTTKPPVVVLEPPQPVQCPEKLSAEAVMKQKVAERKAEREKRRQERDRRRKDKERKRKEKEKRKQMKVKLKTENMIKRAIQIETEALANEAEEEAENDVQWPLVSVVATPTSCKGILVEGGGSKKRKTVQFADGVRPGEGTSPSGGEELSSPPPQPPKLPKEKRYKKLKIPKKMIKKKIKVKVVKRVQPPEEEEDDDEDDHLPPPSPPPGSPPPHIFPSRVKTHTINNVHQYVGNIMQTGPGGFPFRPPIGMVVNRHQPPQSYMAANYHTEANSLPLQQPYQGVSSHH